MDIKTLESFKLSDAVTFHNQLNPKLFHGIRLKPEVVKQLKIIAQDFLNELGVDEINVEDITISGSNAAYSYTPHSDLDLHIRVDMGKLGKDEIYSELFNAKKTIYNDSHDITVHGIPVELYVEDSAEPVVSLGEYSVLKNNWVRLPTKRRASFDQTTAKVKYDKLLDLIQIVLRSKDLSKVTHLLKTIKRYRQAGLDKGGEFGPENISYKALRSQGFITKLYALRDKLHSEKLSIESMYEGSVGKSHNIWHEPTLKFTNPIEKLHHISQEKKVDEASGYIPSEKEKNDPRYKTALTVDVRPNTLQQNAKKLGSKISRAGIPPLLRK